MATRAVIFDRDGVLTSFDVRPAVELLREVPGVSLADVRALWFAYLAETKPPSTLEGERQYLHAFWARVCDAHGLSADVRARLQGFDHRQVIRAFPDAADALRSVRAMGLRIAVLSNFPLADLQGSLANAGLLDLVDAALAASVIGAQKPAPAAYARALEALSVTADECVLIDDEPACVAGARGVGIDAYLLDRSGAFAGDNRRVFRDLTTFVATLRERLATD